MLYRRLYRGSAGAGHPWLVASKLRGALLPCDHNLRGQPDLRSNARILWLLCAAQVWRAGHSGARRAGRLPLWFCGGVRSRRAGPPHLCLLHHEPPHRRREKGAPVQPHHHGAALPGGWASRSSEQRCSNACSAWVGALLQAAAAQGRDGQAGRASARCSPTTVGGPSAWVPQRPDLLPVHPCALCSRRASQTGASTCWAA